MNIESKTPITDSAYDNAPRADYGGMSHMTGMCRTLELELAEANRKLEVAKEAFGKIDSELKSCLPVTMIERCVNIAFYVEQAIAAITKKEN